MKKITFSTLVFVALFVFMQMKALACSCPDMGGTMKQKINWRLKDDKAIFVGKLISINDESADGDRLIKFQVERFWKGALTEEITIATENDRSSCAYPFEKEKTYLIFVNTYNDKLYTGGCIPNREISRATEELKILGKGKNLKRINFK
jgi:hypothetical protein